MNKREREMLSYMADILGRISYGDDIKSEEAGRLLYDISPNLKYGDTLTIRVRMIDEEIDRPKKIVKGDWIDLRAAETIEYKAGDYFKIPLGLAIELPEGYEAYIEPRSSTFEKYGFYMANEMGIVDEKFKGDNDMWQYPAHAVRDGRIEKNTRFCQFRIFEHQPDIYFEFVDTLGNPDRGGVGSTGEK